MIRKRIFKIAPILLVVMGIVGCYPGGYDTYEESDIVVTNYNPEFDFQLVNTYFMPDTISYIEDDEPERVWDSFIIGELEKEFTALGYERLTVFDEQNPPDVVVAVVVLTVNHVDLYNYPYNGYPYPGWGWYGPPYYGYPVIVNYSTGTLNWKMFSPENVDPVEGIIPVEYAAAINGLMGSTLSSTEARISKGISKAFEQSPYLIK